jgi:adenylate cyclase
MTEERTLAAIMFTDITGFTSLMSTDEKKTLAVLEKNRSIQLPVIKKYKGTFIKEIGDGTLSWFSSAVNAVRCAMDIQEQVSRDPDFKLRIGIHLGDVVIKGNYILGKAVNVASRLEEASPPGSILISGQVYEMISNNPDINTEYDGRKEFKNVKDPVDVYQIQLPEVTKPAETGEIDEVNVQAAQKGEKQILLLTFRDLGPDRIGQYIIDGLGEEIFNSLSDLQNVKVLNAASLPKGISTNQDIRDICIKRNIAYTLGGSIKKSKNELRLSVRLQDILQDRAVWTSRFKGDIKDIFGFQEEVAYSISEAVENTLI